MQHDAAVNISLEQLQQLAHAVLKDVETVKQSQPENPLHDILEKIAFILNVMIDHDTF